MFLKGQKIVGYSAEELERDAKIVVLQILYAIVFVSCWFERKWTELFYAKVFMSVIVIKNTLYNLFNKN